MSSTARVAAELAIRHPKTLAADVTIGVVRAQLADDHVHIALLTDGGRLVGTLLRTDLPAFLEDAAPALPHARLDGRVVTPERSAARVHAELVQHRLRRVAVVGADGTLLGLICLNRRRSGFCSDEDVAARAAETLGFCGPDDGRSSHRTRPL